MNCIICHAKLSGRQQKYCSKACKARVFDCYKYQKKRALDRKLELVKESGGKCSQCGYSKNLSALVFHHLDPSQKEFKLDARSLSGHTMRMAREELAKCVLLCSNCHQEVHNPGMDLENLES